MPLSESCARAALCLLDGASDLTAVVCDPVNARRQQAAITVRPLLPDDWELLETLFGRAGACGGCWCMLWRVPSLGKYWAMHKGRRIREAFRYLVRSGRVTGVVACKGGFPLGWCSIAPRSDFPYLSRARSVSACDDSSRWAVSCFFVARSMRRKGIAGALLRGALALAKSRGASGIDAYPVRTGGTSEPDAFVHTGVVPMFEAAGFTHVSNAGARAVYRREFSSSELRRRVARPREPRSA